MSVTPNLTPIQRTSLNVTPARRRANGREVLVQKVCCELSKHVQVLEIARRLASSGPEGLAVLRDAGLLQACLFIIESAAPGSHNAKCAVNLVGRSAEWDECSRYGTHALGDTGVLQTCPTVKAK